ncbi:BA14K family protein [Gluconacetobacter tumulisoli]|uniref:Lectin-like protein BA14k n=1 Tax=Gluconacetobacter tumulisoli TaxID=1286189 RepID=A0A7W4PNE3_9PROT|nr:BA14K family protein [Gluconacetobacter tumulisoli]MBB2202539.1 hypothetical protein [Gluconacetobacter tumulisoli]
MNDCPRPPVARLAVAVMMLSGLAACAPQPVARPAAQAVPRRPPLQFAPGTVVEAPPPANEAQLVNDPSAPLNTPLCGAAARAAVATGARVNPAPLASGNSCVANACFDPLTGTYIGADGNRHVCR